MLRVSFAFILVLGTACSVDQVYLFTDSGRSLSADGGDAAVIDEGIEADGGDAFVPDVGIEPDGGDAAVPDEGVADEGVADSGVEPCVCRFARCFSDQDCIDNGLPGATCDTRVTHWCTGSLRECSASMPCP